MTSNLLFYYFGDDEAYFRALQGEFRRNTRLVIEFKRFFENDEKKIQSLSLLVFNDQPKCVFIDFSKHTDDYLHLARLIRRTAYNQKTILIGLVDYLSPQEVLTESNATGVDLTHIKSAETFDVIYDIGNLMAPKETSPHGFATAKLKESAEVGIPCKVGFINETSLHIETNHRLNKGDKINLNHYWTHKKIIPSKEFFVTDVSTSNLFYQFNYSSDLSFNYVDDFIPREGMEPGEIKNKLLERDELISSKKKYLAKWLEDHASVSLQKKAKVLIVDKNFPFYNDQIRTDKHPYTIRCLPHFSDVGVEIDRFRPQVIAFSLDWEEQPKNTYEHLRTLTQVLLHKYPDLKPFIVVFNCPVSSKELQEGEAYPQILSYSEELSVEVLLKMAAIFDKKLSSILPKETDGRVYLGKEHPAAMAELLTSVTIVKLSETDLVFESHFPFTDGVNLHFTFPVNMYVNVRSSKGNSKVPEFYGLIHCLGEEQKKELRRYVNSIFFREHDAMVQAETEEFKKLNEAKMIERLEEAKKLEEAKAQKSEETAAEAADK